MGLAISRTIIEAHGGQLSASHTLGMMCFRFTLPCIPILSKPT
jgi:signal transduction histidine kinase